MLVLSTSTSSSRNSMVILFQNVLLMLCLLFLLIAHGMEGRELAVGDFDELNDLLNGATIRLPDARVETSVVKVDMTNVRCTNFRLDDVLLTQQRQADTGSLRLQLNVEGLDMECFLDYKYSFIFTRYGTADLYSYDNRASLSVLFESPNYSQGVFHPTESSIEQCFPEVNIANMDFNGDISALVLDTIERLLRDKVEREAESRLCQELQSMSQTVVTDMLKQVDETLDEYISYPTPDPLSAEQALVVPSNVTIVDFSDKRSWKKWLDQVLVDAVAFLTKEVEDERYGTDLNINALIRDNLLDEDEAFHLDVGGKLTLLERHDKFLQTSLLLDSVKVIGLNTLTSFEPLVDIGKHTLQNAFSFRFLTIEMDIIMNMKPSTLPDSIFVKPDGSGITSGGEGVTETIKIKFGVDDLHAIASVLLAIDEAKLGSVSVGALLDVENIFSCFLSTLFGVQVPGLSVSVGSVKPPTLEGFVSPGLDRLITSSVNAAFSMYETTMLEAAPGFFQMVVTEFLNERFREQFPVGGGISDKCTPPLFETTDGHYIDFRDLLLTPEDAKEAGGTGIQPYGDVVYTIVSEVKEQFLAPDEDGSPMINSLIRDFLTESSNLTFGSIMAYPGDVLNTSTSLVMGGFKADLGFRLFDAYVENVDTLGPPIQFLEPIAGEAHMLNNSVSIGVDSDPVRLSAKLLITLKDNANLQLRNEVGINLDLTSAYLGLAILLQILEQPFFAVPLRDTLNLNCWLTTILPSSGNSSGIVQEQHSMSVEDLSLDIGCVSCSSPNFDELIDVLYSEDTKNKVFNFLDLILESDYLRIAIDGFVNTASKQCPNTPDYDENASWGDFLKDAVGGFGALENSRDEQAKWFNVALASITVGLIVIFVVIKWIAKRRNRTLMDSLPPDAVERLRIKEEEENDKQAELNATTQSMFRSQQLPRYVRVLTPFVILLTIALVLVGHLGVLSTVSVVGQFAGESFAVDEILEFSFFSAALRTYNNGGVEVAILLFLFTGVWLAKLVTSLAMFFLPPHKLSVARRGTILLWLDVFAKLSLPDIFMMLLAIGAIMVFIGGADETFVMDGDFFAAKLIVTPGVGFYCIIIGQRITRVTSRYLLNCHHEIVKSATTELKRSEEWLIRASGRTSATFLIEEDDEESRMSDSGRSRHGNEEFQEENEGSVASDSDSVSRASGSESGDRPVEDSASPVGEADQSIRRPMAVLFIAITVVILVIIACVYVPSISIDTKVVWGLLGSGKTFEEAVREFGMFWMISRIFVQSRFVLDSTEDYVGLGFLLALVIVTSLIAPIMKGITYFRRWRLQRQRRPRSSPNTRPPKTKPKASVPLRTKVVASLRRWIHGNEALHKDNDLLPACKLRAWQDLEVYIIAFVVACWQLGAVAGYAIHIYCFILEQVYEIVVYLGLMERTSPQCYRVQTSSWTFVMIVFMSFFVLLASFLLQAASQYRKTMDQTAREMKGIDCDGTEDDLVSRPSVKKEASNPDVVEEESMQLDEDDTALMTATSSTSTSGYLQSIET